MWKNESYCNLATLPTPIPTLPTGEAPGSTLKTIGKILLINDLKCHVCSMLC